MLASLLAGLATGETIAAVRRMRRAVVAYLVAALFALIGLVFLLIAVTIWASRRFGEIEAAVGIGLVFLVVALIIYVVHRRTARVRAGAAARQRNRDLTNAAVAAGVAAAPGLLKKGSGFALLAAPVVAAGAYVVYRLLSRPDPRDDF
jgi:hypothetical protein